MQSVTLNLPEHLCEQLRAGAAASGDTETDFAVKLLHKSLAPSARMHLTAPIVGLVEGLFWGDVTVGQALQYGNFGLGTINGLDGEVVILDGQAFRQGADGSSVPVPSSARTPFMATAAFNKEKAIRLELPLQLDWAGLQMALLEEFPSANIYYAVLVEGSFQRVKARAVRKQTKARPLAAVAREQVVFELEQQEGWLVGFWSPAFMGHALNVPGFHMHFLSTDKQRGGHVLDLLLTHGTAFIQPMYHADTDLPKSLDFLSADLSKDPAADLDAAEK